MQRRLFIAILLFVLLAGAYLLQRERDADPSSEALPQRIVSLAPSITETLFALGAGPRVVGVTRFCRYPPEARTRASVGGYHDLDYEALLELSADLVVLLPYHREAQSRIERLGCRTVTVDQSSVRGILDSFISLGNELDCADRAAALVAELRARMGELRRRMAGKTRPRVLLSAGRSVGTGSLREVFIPGPGNFLDQLLVLAGGTNAYQGSLPYPSVSAEGILEMNPDVVIELVADAAGQKAARESILAEWRSLPGLKAVKNSRVYVLMGDYVTVPGPRFIRTVEDMARVLHPQPGREEAP